MLHVQKEAGMEVDRLSVGLVDWPGCLSFANFFPELRDWASLLPIVSTDSSEHDLSSWERIAGPRTAGATSATSLEKTTS